MSKPVTGKQPAKSRNRVCAHCGNVFLMTRVDVKYCSSACKQAAYRARKTTPMERAIRKARQYQQMVATKASRITETKCCGCGCVMYVTGLEGRGKMYHNLSCKQRAYRERKKLRDAIRNHE